MMVGKKFWWKLFMLLYSSPLFSQEVLTPLHLQAMLIAPRFQEYRNPFSVMVNPSALAFYQQSSWGLAAEKRFSLPGWIQGQGIGILSTRAGYWAISGETSGLEGFRRLQLSISHARILSEGVALGLSMGVRGYKATGYKMLLQPIASLGTFLELTEELGLGFSAFATFPVGEKRAQLGGLNPQLLIHLQYVPSARIFFSVWGAKKNDFPIDLGATLRYRLHEKLSLVAGISIDQHYSWLGISIAQKKIKMMLQLGWHPMLGIGNNFSLYGPHH